MQVLTIEQVEYVSGSRRALEMSENQCIGLASFGGGLVGAAVGAWGTLGIGTFNGFGAGMAAGGALGMIFCGPLTAP